MADDRRRRMTVNERRRLVVVGVTTGALFAIGQVGILASFSTSRPVWGAVLLDLLMGAVFGFFFAWFTARMWRRNGGLASAQALRKALRTRTLPSDADREIWTELLDRQEKELSHNIVYAICIAAAAALCFILGLSGVIPAFGAWVWIGAALFAGIAVLSVVEGRSRRVRIHVLRTQLGPDTASRS